MFNINEINSNDQNYVPPTHIGIGSSRRKIIDVNKLDLTTNEGLRDYIDYKFQSIEEKIDDLRNRIDECVDSDEFNKKVKDLEREISSAKTMALING